MRDLPFRAPSEFEPLAFSLEKFDGVGAFHEVDDHGNKLREAYVDAGVEWVEWSQRANYLRHGFMAGVLYNTATPAMDKPEGYDERRAVSRACGSPPGEAGR